MKFYTVLKQFKLNILILLLVEISETREVAAVLLIATNSFNVGIHSDSYKSIWCKLGIIVDSIKFYSLIVA